MTKECWHDWKLRRKMLSRTEDITQKKHGKVLIELIHGISDLPTIDLGCGNKRCESLFTNYTGVDLPEWNVYKSDCDYISENNVVLMNAFIDVLVWPTDILNKILPYCSNYVIIHRQEITKEKTSADKRDSYGGWTYHTKINEQEFYDILKENMFEIKKELSCGFDNWENGGSSFLLKRIKC